MNIENDNSVWRMPVNTLMILAIIALLLGFIFYDGLGAMLDKWLNQEEYSHGIMIPAISAFLIWQKKDILERISFEGSWFGFLAVVIGVALFILGELSTLYIIIQYAFLVVLVGIFLSYMGWSGLKVIWAPLFLLLLMIPLPNFLYQGLSAQLQLISSTIGVEVIRLFDISVYLEGNVIDLGAFKLQVVEACSGLRYLFPLMTLGFIAAYFYRVAFWKRAIIFISTIPITVLMNSFRIGIIGILVEYWGQSMAEGFLHDFEGWFVFMACTAVLVAEMWVLTKISGESRSLREVFGLEFPEPTPKDAPVKVRAIPKSLTGTLIVLLLAVGLSASLSQRENIIPQRSEFSVFPMELGEWSGVENHLEKIYLDALDLDDYVIADYKNSNNERVNLYVAYYADQAKGESIHSPRSCIPGGGWKISSLTQEEIPGLFVVGNPLVVNRTVIQKGEYKQLVYYWFQQRGRVITNEYLVKWYLFWDALTKNRTDGALVRLVSVVNPGEDIEKADKNLQGFARLINKELGKYIPE